MRKEYASELTREDLIKMGVRAVDFNSCKVYGEQGELAFTINAQGYFMLALYDLDENGNRIKLNITRTYKGVRREYKYETYTYKTRSVSLNRLIWAWKYGKVRSGYVIDHKDNRHFDLIDYRLDNLQEITPAQNLAKERPESKFMLRPAKGVSIEYYEDRLNYYLVEYEKAKKAHEAAKVHKLRSNISQQRAKIRWIQKFGIEF